MARRRSEREIYWKRVIDRQGASGQSIADFCRDEGVSTASFYSWRRRLGFPGRPVLRQAPTPALVPIRIAAEPTRAREAVTIEWPGGVVLRVATGCDAPTLKTIVETLATTTKREADRC